MTRGLPCRPAALLAGALLALAAGAAAQAPEAIHHVHGLAFDRRDPGVLYVATHTGLVRARPGAAPEWVGQHRFDLMGFTAHPAEPDLHFASGHPDIPAYLRDKIAHLGVLVSRDGGRTWRTVGLHGRADFHALTWSAREGGTLWGWSVAGEIGLFRIATRTWTAERVAASGLSGVHALSADPGGDGPLLAGTAGGLLASRDEGRTWRAVPGFPPGGPVTALTHQAGDGRRVFAYLHQAGAGLLTSEDGGETWRIGTLAGALESPVIALAAGPGHHVAAVTADADLLRSSDGGRRWQPVWRRGRPAPRR